MPFGFSSVTRAAGRSWRTIWQKTFCSRTRRAMSCPNCEPKSKIRTSSSSWSSHEAHSRKIRTAVFSLSQSPCDPPRARPRPRPSAPPGSRPRSSACSPAMVVPPGLATASFSAPGCWPVSSTIFAAPSTVCAASARATSRGRPHLHAAVGQRLDDHVDERRAAAAEARSRRRAACSGTRNAVPTAPKQLADQGHVVRRRGRAGRVSRCARPDQARRVRHHADEPRLLARARRRVSAASRPAAIETTRCRAPSAGRSSASTAGITCGLTARTSTSHAAATSRVRVDGLDAGRRLELRAGLGVRVGRAAPRGVEQSGLRPAACERGGHLPGAEEAD